MSLFPAPPAADPLHIFHPDGPINPAFMRGLLHSAISTQPPAADASPEHKADLRLATMHAIAAFQPGDALEAMLAGQMVAANARMMRCLALAAEPDGDRTEARRDGAQATALMRCMQATLRGFLKMRTARRKDEEQPSERAGYWFRDVSVPAPEEEDLPRDAPAAHSERDNPMRRENASPAVLHHPSRMAPRAPASPPSARDNPMRREEPPHPSRHHPMPSGGATPAAILRQPTGEPPRPARPAAASRENPMQRESAAPAAPAVAEKRRSEPMPSEPRDLPGHMTTGDALIRFASRRLDPDQSVEAARAQAEAALS